MSVVQLPPIHTDDLVVIADSDGSALTIRFEGQAATQVQDELQAFLLAAHAQVCEHRLPCVIVDFRGLEFMNSSCFKSFVNWLGQVRALDRDAQYSIRFRTSDDIHWQRRSLRALRAFAARVVHIES